MYFANRVGLRYMKQTSVVISSQQCNNLMTSSTVSLSTATEAAPAEKMDARKMIERQLKCNVKSELKKERSPTAVLEALEETIGSSITPGYEMLSSPHYHSGTYVNARVDKIKYQKKGIEAADYAISTMPDYFAHKWDSGDDIEKWLPQGGASELKHITFDEDMLLEDEGTIEDGDDPIAKHRRMAEMVHRYSKLVKSENADEVVTDEMTNKLFAHVAFYRGLDENVQAFTDNPIQYYWVKENGKASLVEKMFESIKNPTAEHYNVYVRSLVNMGKFKEAFDIYLNVMDKQDMKIDVDCAEAIMRARMRCHVEGLTTIAVLKKLQAALNKHNLVPDAKIFSFIAYQLVIYVQTFEEFTDKIERLTNEMAACGIELGLHHYSEMFRCVTTPNFQKRDLDLGHQILDYIMDKIENDNTLKCSYPYEILAFNEMMKRLEKMNDLERAKRLYGIVTSGNKRKLMRNILNEQLFYQSYMSVVLRNDSLENIWLTKNTLTPTMTRFTANHMSQFFNAIKKEQAFEYIPLLVVDLLKDRSTGNIVHKLFDYMLENLHEITDEDTRTQIKHIALLNFKNPNYLFSIDKKKFDETKIKQEQVINRSLQLVARMNDHQNLRFAIQQFTKFDFSMTAEALEDCEKVGKLYPRIEEDLKRFRNALIGGEADQ